MGYLLSIQTSIVLARWFPNNGYTILPKRHHVVLLHYTSYPAYNIAPQIC